MKKKMLTAMVAAGVMGIGVAAAGLTAYAADYEIKLAFASPPSHPWTVAANEFKETVESQTDGKVSVAVYDSGKLGTLPETTEAVQNGSIEMCLMATMTMSSFVPEVQILDFPYLFPTSEIAEEILDGELGAQIMDVIDAKGFKTLCFLDNDYRCFSNNKHTIETPEDMAGLKIRIPETPVLVSWLESLEAIPTIIAASETYSSVQTGIVDGQDNGVMLTMTDKYYEVVKYFSTTNHIYGSAVAMMNADFWDSLPEEYQQVIQDAAYVLRDSSREMIREQKEEYKEEMAKTVEVTEITEENLQKFVDSARAIYPDFYDQVDAELLDAIMAKVDELSQ